ncbi:hypothetical protein TYRP_008951 [Tyrophagus putrescentiae]|nr:hypothetical protein TYRP_008951 [Tyrophagus putrescentiae]
MAKYLLVSFFALILAFENVVAQDNSNPKCTTIGDACRPDTSYLMEFPLNYTDITGEQQVKWPTTDKDVSAYCTHLDDLQNCLKGLINQSNGTSASKLGGAKLCKDELIQAKKIAVMLSVYFKSVCITAKRRQDALQRVECYKKPEVHQKVVPIAYRTFVMVTFANVNNGSTEDGNGGGDHQSWCCAMLYFRDSTYQVNQQYCSPETTEEIHHLVQDVIGPTYHQSCGKATTYKQCFSDLPPEKQAVFKDVENLDINSRKESLLKF